MRNRINSPHRDPSQTGEEDGNWQTIHLDHRYVWMAEIITHMSIAPIELYEMAIGAQRYKEHFYGIWQGVGTTGKIAHIALNVSGEMGRNILGLYDPVDAGAWVEIAEENGKMWRWRTMDLPGRKHYDVVRGSKGW